MHRIRRRMLVASLFPLALLAGCVHSPAHKAQGTQSVVTVDKSAETPLLAAPPLISADPLPALTTTVSGTVPYNAEESPTTSSPASPPPPVVNYTVGQGETLWSIAARQNIYADALLWPLLYQANRDQIRDPRQIFPGQTLSIPRTVSEAQKEETREAARRSNIFPLNLPPAPSN